MKTKKWLFVLGLALAFCLIFSACAKEDAEQESGSESETETAQTSDLLTLTIDGKDISEYKIVYAHSPLENKVGSNTGKTVGEDLAEYLQGENKAMDFDYQTAVRLQTLIKEKTGKTLELEKDSVATQWGEREILVGLTNRTASKNAVTDMKMDDFVCKLVETRYVICGDAYGTTWHAVDALEKKLGEADKTLDLKSADLSGSYAMKKVACVGDSITRGSQALADNLGNATVTKSWGPSATGIYFEQYLGYPCVMQREMWQEYRVFNFGMGQRTMIKTGSQYRYRDCAKYTELMSYSDRDDVEFDLVLIMLGTNDSAIVNNETWPQARVDEYIEETQFLVDSVVAGSPDAQFVLLNVPHRCDGDAPLARDAGVRRVQALTVQTLAGTGRPILLYDMERFTIDNLTSDPSKEGQNEVEIHKDYYNMKDGATDKTHPSYLGYGKIAEGMQELAEHLLDDGRKPDYLA